LITGYRSPGTRPDIFHFSVLSRPDCLAGELCILTIAF
jgi:hypothetical protein